MKQTLIDLDKMKNSVEINFSEYFIELIKDISFNIGQVFVTGGITFTAGDICHMGFSFIQTCKCFKSGRINIFELGGGFGFSTSFFLSLAEILAQGKKLDINFTTCEIDLQRIKMLKGIKTPITYNVIDKDITKNKDSIPQYPIHYLFIDCLHTSDMAQWYIKNLFPKVPIHGKIVIHDILLSEDRPSLQGESKIVIRESKKNIWECYRNIQDKSYWPAFPPIPNSPYDLRNTLMILTRK